MANSQSPSRTEGSPVLSTTPLKKKLTIQTMVHDDEPPAKVSTKSLSDRFGDARVTMTAKKKTVLPSDVQTLSVKLAHNAPVKTKKIVNKPKKAAASALGK